MVRAYFGLALMALASIPQATGYASTDTFMDGDLPQSGYLPNHNMDPTIVDSAAFGQLWNQAFNNLEKFYAKPLVYTPTGGTQLVILASSQNIIRSLDAKTGAPVNTRQVHPPFLVSDLGGCNDIPDTIGIIGTPTIDPQTDIMYFFSKTYIPNFRVAGNTGTYNGVYYFHGVDTKTLQDVAGFPILVDGSPADNAPLKYFVGGIILQRPSLVQVGSVVYGAFGGHCDKYNYTGTVIGVDVNAKKIASNFAIESGPLAAQTNNWQEDGGGGLGGIWQSGMAISTDGSRIFVVSGNGQGHENGGTPASGSSGCHTLGEACVSLGPDDTGKLVLKDYFQPYNYEDLDAGDQDLGSSGLTLLDPTVFNGPGISRMGATAGKNGVVYIVNANNLGGYKNGPSQTDNIIQSITTAKSIFGGIGSYPLEGGYIYATPVGFPSYVYKLGYSSSGAPIFSQVGQTHESSAGRVGTGIPTITSYQGKAGTGILWMCDPDAGLRAWHAVPGSDGYLQSIRVPQVNGLNKFQRPAFGDGRLYVTDSNGVLYALGSPVNLPLNCTSVDFGNVALGSKSNQTVSCTANVFVTSVDGLTVADAHFKVDNSTLPKGSVAAGQTFTFPVAWDLTNANVTKTPNVTYGNTSPGVKSTALNVFTTNSVAGYLTAFPISLTGVEVSQKPFLTLAPIAVNYPGIVVSDHTPTESLPFTLGNSGLTVMTILGYAYTTDDVTSPTTQYTNVTFQNGSASNLGVGFSSVNLPPVGTMIQNGSSISVDAVFNPVNGVGTYKSFLYAYSSGGNQYTILEGSASTAPVANFSISSGEGGGWLPPNNLLMDFGNVSPGSTQSRQIRICNNGGSVLSISKSKPPAGVFHIDDPTELHESQSINIGDCAYGTIIMNPPFEEYNIPDIKYSDTWTLNTNDLSFGVHVVSIKGTLIDNTTGPKNASGLPVYEYLGCYHDAAPNGRLLPNQKYAGANNSNGNCQELCLAGGYVFQGTEFQSECYCGNTPPSSTYLDPYDVYCTYTCSGDVNSTCGGYGGYISIYYDPTKYTKGDNSSTPGAPSGGPIAVSSTGNFNYIGCFSEGTAGRALSGLAPPPPSAGWTIETCGVACNGYSYFGMEYANECYCGNTIGAGSVNQTSADPTVNGCNMACAGNATEYCGGGNRLEMYATNGTTLPTGTISTSSITPTPTPTGGPFTVQTAGLYSYSGCYVDNAGGQRALAALQNPESGSGNTVEACAAACMGYKYFGVEYGAECYCDNAIQGTNSVATGGSDPTQNGCSMACAGNATEYCGGPNRLNVYILGAGNTTTTTLVSSTVTSILASIAPSTTITSSSGSATTITTTSATPTPTGPITVTTLPGHTYLGCYSEATNMRALSDLMLPIAAANVSVENCAAACTAYTYFGVEYAQECYCGNTINTGSVLVAGTDPNVNGCNMVCAANSTEYCGGGNRLNMYQLAPQQVSTSIIFKSSTASSIVISTSSVPVNITTTMVATSVTSTTLVPTTISIIPSSTLISSTTSLRTSSALATSASTAISSSTLLFSTTKPTMSSTTIPTTSTTTVPTTSTTIISTTSTTIVTTKSSTTLSTSSKTLSTSSTAPTSTTVLTTTTAPATSSTIIPTTSSTPTSTLRTSTISTTSLTPITSSTTIPTTTSSSIPIKSTTLTTLIKSTSTSSASATPTSPWTYVGCANETSSRALSNTNYANTTGMTIESCQSFCYAGGYGLAGLEYSQECWCGYKLGNGSTIGQTGCDMPCKGNSAEICGGPNRLSLYSLNGFVMPSVVSNVGNYTSKGCYQEAVGVRLLAGPTYTNTTGMTVESCVGFCAGQKTPQPYAGVEYGSECYCATSLPTTAVQADNSTCNERCSGNKNEYCGAGYLLNIYSTQ